MSGKQNSNYTRDHDFNIKQISWTSISYFSRALTLLNLINSSLLQIQNQIKITTPHIQTDEQNPFFLTKPKSLSTQN